MNDMNPTRERDAMAYKLVKADEIIDKLERANEKLSDEVNAAAPLFDQIRAELGPLSGVEDWQRAPIMTVVRAVVEKIKGGT
jgi:hypothetical protein